jgi:transposase-like protein
MEGEVEIDEFYMKSGLKGRTYSSLIKAIRSPRKRGLKMKGRGTFEKDLVPCFILSERGKLTKRVIVSMHANEETARIIIQENVREGTTISTDEFAIYNFLDYTDKYRHVICNHSRKEYVNGSAHVNGCEGFISTLRVMMARHRGVNKFNLQKYIDGCIFSRRIARMGSGEKIIEYVIKCLVISFFYFSILWILKSSNNIRHKSVFVI